MRKRLGQWLVRLGHKLHQPVEFSPVDPRVAAIDRQTKALVAVGDMIGDRVAGSIPQAVNAICWQMVGPQLAAMIDGSREDGVGDEEILSTLLERLTNGWLSEAPRVR